MELIQCNLEITSNTNPSWIRINKYLLIVLTCVYYTFQRRGYYSCANSNTIDGHLTKKKKIDERGKQVVGKTHDAFGNLTKNHYFIQPLSAFSSKVRRWNWWKGGILKKGCGMKSKINKDNENITWGNVIKWRNTTQILIKYKIVKYISIQRVGQQRGNDNDSVILQGHHQLSVPGGNHQALDGATHWHTDNWS